MTKVKAVLQECPTMKIPMQETQSVRFSLQVPLRLKNCQSRS